MRFARALSSLALIVAMVAYVADCAPMSNPADAIHCCGSMPCHTRGSAQDCCKTMSVVHLPFVQSAALQVSVYSPALAALTVINRDFSSSDWERFVTAYGHAPPGFAPQSFSLRI